MRIHKYIINNLIRAHAYNIINNFIDRAITGAKQYPEIFLWVAKNLLTRAWDYEWLDYSRDAMLLTYFRLMGELKKIEVKGSRLKNMSVEIIFANDAAVLKDIIAQGTPQFLGKLYDMVKGVSHITEQQADKFYSLIKAKYPDFKPAIPAQEKEAEEWAPDIENCTFRRADMIKYCMSLTA